MIADDRTNGETPRERISDARLYLCCGSRESAEMESLLEQAIEGGVDVIQLREKSGGRDEILGAAEIFRRVADRTGALFVLNDDPELAIEVGADGVHVGQDDLASSEARRVMGEERIVGLSTHREDQMEAALVDDAIDYFSVGPVWPTPTKEGRPAAGLEYVDLAASRAGGRPWFAIGGIDSSNLSEVLDHGARRVCVVRAIADAADPRSAALALKQAILDR
ncbi:MAG: thiamine phosphate synthase [bacterium]